MGLVWATEGVVEGLWGKWTEVGWGLLQDAQLNNLL